MAISAENFAARMEFTLYTHSALNNLSSLLHNTVRQSRVCDAPADPLAISHHIVEPVLNCLGWQPMDGDNVLKSDPRIGLPVHYTLLGPAHEVVAMLHVVTGLPGTAGTPSKFVV